MTITLESFTAFGPMVGHASYVLLVASMMMTRMIWLRVLAIASGIVAAIHSGFWLHDPVTTVWEVIFSLTNLGQLALITYRNSRARFTPEERAFYEIAVPGLDPSQAHRLLKGGRWVDAAAGTVLTRQGERVPDLAFVVSGEIEVKIGDRTVGNCGTGDFIGEVSISTGLPAMATATAVTPIRYLAFRREYLTRLLDRSDEIGRAVELSFRHGLAAKLTRTNAALVATGTPMP